MAFIKEGSDGTASPLNNTTYTANTAFGSGSQIGTTGWYCLFNGTTHSSGVTVTNLSPCKTYRVMVCEYSGSPGSEIYNPSAAEGNPRNVQTSGSGGVIPTEGLVGYWPFNGNANDESGNGNNGTVYGATLIADRFGNNSAAYGFNGSTNYIDIPNSASLSSSTVNNTTICAWVNNLSTGGEYFYLGINYATSSYELYDGDTIQSSNRNWLGVGGKWYDLKSTISTNIDTWYFITSVFDYSNLVIKLYINGIYNNQLTCPLMGKPPAPHVEIGRNPWPESYVNGHIDDVRIYNRALTATEIQALYHEGEQTPLTVTSPNGGERWKVGDIHPITWTSCGVDNVKIEYSINNGTNWTTIINETPASVGSYSWTVPNTPSELCLVKITSTTDGTIFDQSDAVFAIYKETIPQIIVTSPNGDERWKVGDIHQITWTSSSVANIKIEYSIDNGTFWATIVESTAAAPGSYPWTIPNTPSESCLLKITSTTDGTIFDQSDTVFTIYKGTIPEIIVTAPNGGERWKG
ncbi:MAG: LamG-like jellyroll fold domain-containing protein, partial [Bacteroidota bacterium]